MTRIPFAYNTYRPIANLSYDQWKEEMADMLTRYLKKEPIYVAFTDPKRQGSVGRLIIKNVQELLGGSSPYTYWGIRPRPQPIEEKPENVNKIHFGSRHPTGHVRWDKRSNTVNIWGADIYWLKDHEGPTVWAYEKKPNVPKVQAVDKLDREIKVNDFISYILYNFDNGSSAAGIYYGKVSKIDPDGTVYAKNIKLQSKDRSEEKRIKDNSLIVIMSKDLMDKLMLARLSIL